MATVMGALQVPLAKPTKRRAISPTNRVVLLDVSELYRPEGKDVEDFRIYDEKLMAGSDIMRRVYETYLKMHTNQTLEFVKQKHEEWLNFSHGQWNVMDALELLNSLIDESDPDVDIPNIVHAFQTAERIREKHPDEDWFHLTGLIHDLGKVMALWGEEQWAVVGDTFPVGCMPADSVVFRKSTFKNNPEVGEKTDYIYNTQCGIYKPNCGLDNITMSWGHDEYLYRVLRNHKQCRLPDEALAMIRYHSFYPWHTGGDYWYLANEKDHDMYYWIREFNKFDLYSKGDDAPDIDELRPYYQSLVDKYLPGAISF